MSNPDLSKYQGPIDFAKLSKVIDFVILRVQSGYTVHDSKYKEYVAGCKQYGISFGTYAYFKGVSVPDSIAEAKSALELMDPDSKFFALDIEENCNRDLVGTGQAFIDYLKNKGVQKVGLYSGESFFNAHNLGNIKCDFIWIAKYGPNDGQPHTKPSVTCDLWQYTSVGKLDGINGNVDLNQLTGTKSLDFFTGKTEQKGIQPFGTATIDYPAAYGVNAYDAPNGQYKQKLPGGFQYDVYAEKDGFFDVGQSTWIKQENCILKRKVIQIDYPSNYGVNAYDGPHGNFKQKIQGGLQFVVYNVIDGFYDIGQSTWVPADCVKVI